MELLRTPTRPPVCASFPWFFFLIVLLAGNFLCLVGCFLLLSQAFEGSHGENIFDGFEHSLGMLEESKAWNERAQFPERSFDFHLCMKCPEGPEERMLCIFLAGSIAKHI